MTGIIATIKAAFSAIGAVFGFLKDKQLLDAGEARGDAKRSKEALDNVAKATAAASDPDNISRLRSKYRRD